MDDAVRGVLASTVTEQQRLVRAAAKDLEDLLKTPNVKNFHASWSEAIVLLKEPLQSGEISGNWADGQTSFVHVLNSLQATTELDWRNMPRSFNLLVS